MGWEAGKAGFDRNPGLAGKNLDVRYAMTDILV